MEARNGYREVSIATSSWERFCKDEARDAAGRFVERMRGYKQRDPAARGVHESFFASEFSARFIDEVLAQSREESKRGGTSRKGRKISGGSVGGGRSWWNIFRWGRSSRASGASGGARRGGSEEATSAGAAVLDGLVSLLNMNDPSQELLWQQCRLLLTSERGNYQLEVFSPPKSSNPKMSLFCFLIEDVRSTTTLELPDFTSTFVVKSQNHGEHVFDAGTEKHKLQWIRAILQFSSKRTNGQVHSVPLANGAPQGSRTTSLERSRTFSHPHSPAPALTATHPPPLTASHPHSPAPALTTTHPPSPLRLQPSSPVSPEVHIESLNSSPIIFGRNSSVPLARRTPSESEEPSVTVGPRITSDDSILCDITPFMQTPPPSQSRDRRRRVQSMVVDPSALAVCTIVSPTSPPPSMTAPPSSSPPPPLPKRNSPRQRCGSCSNRASASSSSVELPRTTAPRSPDTDTRSCSSLFSALHPVSLAAVNQRMSSRGSPSLQTSATSLNNAASQNLSDAAHRSRKISAPAFPVSTQSAQDMTGLRRDRVNAFSRGRHGEAWTGSAEQLVATPTSTQPDVYSSAFIDQVIASSERNATIAEEPPRIETGATSAAERLVPPPLVGMTDLEPLLVVAGSEVTGLRTNSAFSSPTGMAHEDERLQTPSTRSNSQSDSEALSERQLVNPIFIETAENYNQQVATYTHHPYEAWATNQQDVENLRDLARFHWFHGMISRANASHLVLVDGEEGFGQYLVRQSESREGDFVLTFNYHNRAKHLRMAVDTSGCSIQHLWFDDVPTMLDYFKTNSIPLESFWLNDDVKLTTYIHRSASDAFRTTTIVNTELLSRTPPRRTHSLHLSMSQSVGSGTSVPSTPSPTEGHLSRGPHSNSLPQSTRNSVGWRQLFRTQRAASAGNVGRVQRRHSTNAGSILGARRNQSNSRGENNYV